MKDVKFLSKGLFEKDFMQSKATTRNMTTKEKFLGYILGPAFVVIYNCMISYLREIFYVDVWQFDINFGAGAYMSMHTTATVLSTITGLLIGYLTAHTVSRAGRIRPYVLIGSLIMAVSGVAMFWNPFDFSNKAGFLAWVYFTNIVFYAIGSALFALRVYMLALSTRNVRDRDQVTTLRTSVDSMVPGVFVAIIVMGVLYYMFLQVAQYAEDGTFLGYQVADASVWLAFIAVPAVLAIPGAFIEYFWTRERITEDDRLIHKVDENSSHNVPVMTQIKALLTNKYYIMAMLMAIVAQLLSYLQGSNCRQYFTQYVLGATGENGIGTMYLMIAMQPMAIGAVLFPILAKKIGVRKITLVSAIVTLIGIAICMIDPSNFAIACGGGLVFSLGQVAIAFMSGVFVQQACDDVEYKNNFRPEGLLGVIIITNVYTLLLSPLSALFETVLVNYTPYQKPIEELAFYLCDTKNWIIFCYYGGYAIQAAVILIVMIFFNIEKKYPEIQAELKRRRIAACEARGEVWIDDEERERLEREESDRQAEIDRIADLKAKCAKKGLDFDTENQKYLDAKTAKEAKWAAKQAKKEAKKAAKVKK